MKNLLQKLSKKHYTYVAVLFTLFQGMNTAKAQCSMTVSASVTNVSCYNGTNGSITVSVSGTTAPYLYQLAEAGAGAWNSANSFSGLAANIYPVSVKDKNNCIQTIYVTVSQPANYVINYTATDVTCTGGNNGSIAVNVTGGTTPYVYSWSKNGVANFATTASISGLYAANYNLVVTDSKGCTTAPIVEQQVKALGLTGFNEDVVANGSHKSPSSVTTQAFDDGDGAVLYEDGYTNASSTAETPGGLPTGGSFVSTQDAGRPYQLASYSANNSLLLRSATATSYGGAVAGKLVLQSQYRSNYSTLYVLGSTGSGTGTVDYTVHFADATISTGQLTFADWYLASSAQSAIKLKRINRGTGDYDTRYDFNLFELPVTISGPDQTKIIDSVNFAWSNAGSARVNLMAITGYTSTSYGIRINDGTSSTVTPDVNLTSSAAGNTFCTNQSVTFTANPINGGTTPTYVWKKNGTIISGVTTATYTTTGLSNNDKIKVTMTSSLPCVSTSSATSNTLTMTNGTATAAVGISASATSVCSGTTVSFTAAPTNGGASPVYQWKVNNVNVGGNSPTWASTTLNDNDVVKVSMTSSIGCAVNSPATSSTVTVAVANNVLPAITLSSVPLMPYNGAPAAFATSIVNGGTIPAYQWYKNGTAIPGAILPVLLIASASTADLYSVKLTSSNTCVTAPFAMSNYIAVISSPLPITLVNFAGTKTAAGIKLNWKTSIEINARSFIVERSANSNNAFSAIGQVAATGNANGSNYDMLDANVSTGTYFYRLKMVDNNGTYHYSNIISFTISTALAVNTNPFKDNISISLPAGSGTGYFRLLDAAGRTVLSENRSLSNQSNITINVSGKVIAGGVYILDAIINNEHYVTKLIKQ